MFAFTFQAGFRSSSAFQTPFRTEITFSEDGLRILDSV